MEVQELRVGNHIIDCYNIINTVASIHKGGSVRFEDGTICHVNKCKPLLLTEELFLKYGFIKRSPTGYYFDFKKISINIPDLYYNNICLPYKIRYSHQLQNIYYALTGTELEINL